MTEDSRSFWAWLVVTIGVLIVLLCGPCTLLIGGAGILSLLRGDPLGAGGMMLVLALIVGGLPTVGGVVLVLNGWESLKKGRQAPARPDNE